MLRSPRNRKGKSEDAKAQKKREDVSTAGKCKENIEDPKNQTKLEDVSTAENARKISKK